MQGTIMTQASAGPGFQDVGGSDAGNEKGILRRGRLWQGTSWIGAPAMLIAHVDVTLSDFTISCLLPAHRSLRSEESLVALDATRIRRGDRRELRNCCADKMYGLDVRVLLASLIVSATVLASVFVVAVGGTIALIVHGARQVEANRKKRRRTPTDKMSSVEQLNPKAESIRRAQALQVNTTGACTSREVREVVLNL